VTFIFPNATKIFLHSVTALRDSAVGLLYTRTHLDVFTTEVGWDLHKENDKNDRSRSVCLFV
jgi:hypothetical protein